MSVTSYTPESWRIIHEAKVDFRQRVIQSMIHIVQYDKSLPIIEIKLYSDGKPWELPSNVTDVRVRWGKRDHTYVHTSILGHKVGDRSTVYLEIIDQMTVFYGEHNPVLEVFIGEDKIACSSYIPFYIDRNPVQNSDVESEITPSVIDELKELIDAKQDELVPGENIKNINGESIMGSGNIELPTVEYVEAHINDTSNPHSVTKAQIGLSNVDNTSDLDKPISTATQTAITNIIASINTHTNDTNNPHSVTKAQVGLGSVVNTGDSDEPLQNGTTKFTTGGAYTLKTGLETNINTHTSDTNNPHSVTKAQVGLSDVVNTGDSATPVQNGTTKFTTGGAYTLKTGLETAINSHVTNTNNPHSITKAQVGLGNVANTGDSDTPLQNGTTKFTTGGAYALKTGLETNINTHTSDTNNPHSVTKAQVGLGNVANTGDSATPVQNGTTKFTTGGAYTLKTGLETAINSHVTDTSNPHSVTKAQVGLGNVDNTSDLNKPISTATQTALNMKVDKVTGKGLSTNDFTNAYKDDVDANTEVRHSHSNKSILDNTTASYIAAEKTKLGGIESNAQVNILEGVKVNGTDLTVVDKKVNIDLSAFITKTVDDLINYYKKSETYNKSEVNDLISSIQTIQILVVESLPAVGQSNIIYLMSDPHGTGDIYDEYLWVNSTQTYEKIGNTDIDLSAYSTTAQMNEAIATAISTALASYYTKTETNTLLNAKVDKITGKGLSTNDYTTSEKTKLEGIESGAQVNTVNSVANKTGDVVLAKSDVGLGSVVNTGDSATPVENGTTKFTTGGAYTLKTGLETTINSHATNTSNPHSVTKAQVGLGSVVNTGDSNTPVENGTTKFTTGGAYTLKTGLETSINIHVANTSNPHSVTKAQVGLGSVVNTSDSSTPVENGTTKFTTGGAYTLKTGLETTINTHVTNTSNPHSVTKAQVGLGSVVNTGDSATPVQNGTTKFTTGGAYTLKTGLETAINTHTQDTSNPHGVTKAQVGLGNVDNTSDLNKPISTATQAALNAKQATLVPGTNIKTINGASIMGSGDLEVNTNSIEVVNSLPVQPDDDTIYLSNTNASSSGGIVELPVPTASDAGKAFLVNSTGAVVLGTIASGGGITETTWSALKAMRDGGTLTSGALYRITDYQCTTVTTDTSSAGHQFDVIVLALESNRLSEEAWAARHAGDTYFAACNLSAWQLWYCIDNDTGRFAWADSTNGKGVIYRMIDEFGNDVPYDFKNILFTSSGKYTNAYTFSYTQSGAIKDASLSGLINLCYGNIMKEYISPNKQQLNFNVFYSTSATFQSRSNTLGTNCYSNTFGTNCVGNSFGNDCYSNTFGDYCANNKFGDYCSGNTFGTSCGFNTFGNYCRYNTFGNICRYNTFGSNCNSNIFGISPSPIDYCRHIILDNGCSLLQIYSADTSASASNCLQNVHVHSGVSGSSHGLKTIRVPDRNLEYSTDYYANGSQTVILD